MKCKDCIYCSANSICSFVYRNIGFELNIAENDLEKERNCSFGVEVPSQDKILRYHSITNDDMVNGEGMRVVLWVAGCSHGCEGCHNKLTWDINCGELFDKEAKQKLFDELEKDYITGLTLSGGDPLHIDNRASIENLILEVKEKFPNKDIWLYTGYTWEYIINNISINILTNIDVIIDGEFKKELYDPQLQYRGSSNQRIINVKKELENIFGDNNLICRN